MAADQTWSYPHHENEIAQSEAATGKQYATTWMHAGAVRVDGEKMSKSLDNFFTIRDVLEKYHRSGALSFSLEPLPQPDQLFRG